MFRFIYNGLDFSHKIDTANDPSDDYTRHMHHFHEIIYFIDGDVRYTIADETALLIKGDFLFIPAGTYHFADINREKLYDRYVFQFPNTILPDLLIEKINKVPPFLGSHKEFLSQFNQFDDYHNENNFSNDELYTVFVCEIIKILILVSKESNEVNKQRNEILSPIIKYIDENLQENITLGSISKRFNYSISYVSSEFKRQMRIPLMQYVRTKKIIAAHNMLLTGKKKGEVAEYFGFHDYSTFYRAYISVMGYPPSGSK